MTARGQECPNRSPRSPLNRKPRPPNPLAEGDDPVRQSRERKVVYRNSKTRLDHID